MAAIDYKATLLTIGIMPNRHFSLIDITLYLNDILASRKSNIDSPY